MPHLSTISFVIFHPFTLYLAIEDTYADYVSWEGSLTPPGPVPDTNAALQNQYKQACAQVEARKAFEENVAGFSLLGSNALC